MSRLPYGAAVNRQWPKPCPAPHPETALRAAKKLWRVATGKAWPGTWKLTSGNRSTWFHGTVFSVNPESWRDMVHDLSHKAYNTLTARGATAIRINGSIVRLCSDAKRRDYATALRKPHADDHLQLEAGLTQYVLQHGWINERPEPKAVPAKERESTVARRHRLALAALDRAEHRLRLAQAAVARLKPRVARYEAAMRRKAAA